VSGTSLDDKAASLAIDILVETSGWPPEDALTKIADAATTAAIASIGPKLADDAELSIVFTDDAHIRVLNGQYRGKDSATNVLSFPGASAKPGTFGPLLGDLVLARETIAREAEEEGISVEHHLTHLLVHGFLHLLGYDHERDDEAVAMEALETAILADLGVADPYGGRAG
jgi:probable rRNA maturation factor